MSGIVGLIAAEALPPAYAQTVPARADIVIPIDPQHNAGAILFKDRAGIV